MSLRHIHFPLKDAGLRDDVGMLGALVGEVVEEQAGEAVLTQVESARRAAIRRRQGDPEGEEELADALAQIEDTSSFIRAYSVFFQVVNLAERVHQIRRKRDYHHSSDAPQPGGIEEAVKQLAAAGIGLSDFQALLDRLSIEPVFTAHPTESTRRSILRKHLRVARMMVERLNPSLSPQETRRLLARIRGEVTTLWQTEEHPDTSRTVGDESEHVLFYLTEILYRIVPPFYEALEEAAGQVYGAEARQLNLPGIIRFGSWVGGDMDGNPNVTAATILDTVRIHRSAIFDLYRAELEGLYQQLTQSGPHSSVSRELLDTIEAYERAFPDTVAHFPIRHRNMPYRRFIRLIQAKLEATLSGEGPGYHDHNALIADLQSIAESLKRNRGRHAGLFLLERMMVRVRTFEFHLAALDLRQDSEIHLKAVGTLLDDSQWEERPSHERARRLIEILDGPPRPPSPAGGNTAGALAVFQAIRRARSEIGDRTIGIYIVSMTRGMDDVLSVLALAKCAGLEIDGRIPLDVAPLFETVEDLHAAPEILGSLLADTAYRAHLEARGDRQVVMIGYSDSTKDGGITAARWALHRVQTRLVEVAGRHGIELTLFHGRGGTVSRGGGRVDRAIEASPTAYAVGRFRMTEQGEMINQRYGVRDIAELTCERMFAPMALATAGLLEIEVDPVWEQIADTIAEESRKTYRALVYGRADFLSYFRSATPIDVIERMQIGSRPSSRRQQRGIEDLRAIPWVFAWTQSRHQLSGWYGVGSGLVAAVDRHGEQAVENAIRNWPYLSTLLGDIERDLAAADLDIARFYAELTGEADHPVYRRIREEHERSVARLLALKNSSHLLENDEVLRRAIDLRSPYIDPLSLLQVRLLRDWRKDERPDDDRLRQLVSTVNGIAQGVQNTG